LSALPRTIAELRRYPWTLLLLLAVLLYNDGIRAVFALAAQFGQEELGLSVGTLTQVILMVQFVAFAGALLFGHVARWLGAKRAVILSLIIWIVPPGYVAGALRTQTGFFLVAAVIGVVQGGSQALSRSLYTQVIPRDRAATYFGLYETSERGTSWLAPLAYGVVLQISGSYRLAVLSLTIFFALGLALLAAVDVRRGVAAAETRVLEKPHSPRTPPRP
jgi:UMF1 family MFS transporter